MSKRVAFAVLLAGVAVASVAAEARRAQAIPVQQGRGGGGPGGLQAPPSAMPKGTGIILGQVVDASTSQPVPGAVVTMIVRPQGGAARGAGPQGPPPGSPVPAPSPIAGAPVGSADHVMADSDGRFVFHDLPAGTVQLSAMASGYLNSSVGQTQPAGRGRPIPLDDGQRLGDVKILMWKYAVMTGTVLDDAGEPAVGVSVRAFRKVTVSGRPQLSGSTQTRTDDRGMFRLSQLTPGDYLVAIPQSQATMPAAIMDGMMNGIASGAGFGTAFLDVMSSGGPMPAGNGLRVGEYLTSPTSGVAPLAPASDGRLFVYQTLFYPAATSPAQAASVVLRSGEERSGLNFQLRVVPTARVSGTVNGPDGPAPNIGVRLMPADASDATAVAGAIGLVGLEAATTATNADGTFVFLGVPPGQYVAKVLKQPRPQIPAEMANGLAAFAFGPGMAAPPTGTAALTLFAQAAVAVGGADVSGLALNLTEGMKVSGRMVFEGALQKPTPQQMTQMRITLVSSDGKGTATIPVMGNQPMTDQGGSFKTGGYGAGKYLTQVSGPVPAGWMIKSAETQGRDAMVQPLELRDGDVNDLVITYTDRVAQLAGTVRAMGASAPPASTVILFPADFASWMANGMSPRLNRNAAPAPKTGAYTLNGLLAGDYLVVALDDRDVAENQDAAYIAALSRVATRITIGDGEKKSLDLTIARLH